ncbi:hypothetical protein CBR_g55002 [Chara braunii]|uniref:Uncharacterized protein n=1 Tax=Chara braunii TaxID=69332 RepID=A0A388K7V6_CHABU|nr:hypothetical protein CBR_g55002 [Chara braunii]|eukprot:GBG66023.1 hypothetical protein CBR_g55002 [Chara braunii]
MEDSRQRLQDMVSLLSASTPPPPEVVGGAISVARWVETVLQQMLEVIWVLEEGPAPELDELVDWRQVGALLNDCYALLDEGSEQGADMAKRSGGELSITMLAAVAPTVSTPMTTSTPTAISAPAVSTQTMTSTLTTKSTTTSTPSFSPTTIAPAPRTMITYDIGRSSKSTTVLPSLPSSTATAVSALVTTVSHGSGRSASIRVSVSQPPEASPTTITSPQSIGRVTGAIPTTISMAALQDLGCSSPIRETASYLPSGKLASVSSQRSVLLAFAIQPFARGEVG